MKNGLLFLLIPLLFSCNTKTESKTELAIKEVKKDTINHKNPVNKEHKDIVKFISYNDDGDYTLLNVKQGNNFRTLINDNNKDRSFLRGDLVEIIWKNGTISIAGDGERKEKAELIISAKKVKDGNLSIFKKNYKKQIKYSYSQDENYTDSYKNELYKCVEYYLANSKNELVKQNIKSKSDLTYSIEQQVRENQEYTVLGISSDFENHTNLIQWLYYDTNKNKLYEYDLPNDKLIEFE